MTKESVIPAKAGMTWEDAGITKGYPNLKPLCEGIGYNICAEMTVRVH